MNRKKRQKNFLQFFFFFWQTKKRKFWKGKELDFFLKFSRQSKMINDGLRFFFSFFLILDGQNTLWELWKITIFFSLLVDCFLFFLVNFFASILDQFEFHQSRQWDSNSILFILSRIFFSSFHKDLKQKDKIVNLFFSIQNKIWIGCAITSSKRCKNQSEMNKAGPSTRRFTLE